MLVFFSSYLLKLSQWPWSVLTVLSLVFTSLLFVAISLLVDASRSSLLIFSDISPQCPVSHFPESLWNSFSSDAQPKFVTENPPSASQRWSCLILSRFPKIVTKNLPSASQRWSCLILSRFPKFVTENPPSDSQPDRVWSCSDFPNSSRKILPQSASPDRVWSC